MTEIQPPPPEGEQPDDEPFPNEPTADEPTMEAPAADVGPGPVYLPREDIAPADEPIER